MRLYPVTDGLALGGWMIACDAVSTYVVDDWPKLASATALAAGAMFYILLRIRQGGCGG